MAPSRAKKSIAAGIIASSVALTGLAVATIKPFEGRELQAYQDIVGIWTICDGETLGVHKGQVKTDAECDTDLARNLGAYEQQLDACLIAPVPGKTKVALLSWEYNVGAQAACNSTLVRKANAGDLVGACNELPRWNRAGGKEVAGLTKRRAAEQRLCLDGLAKVAP